MEISLRPHDSLGALPRTPARATRPLQTRGEWLLEGLRPSNPSKGVTPFAIPNPLLDNSLENGDILTLLSRVTF